MAVECADPDMPQFKPGTDVYRNILFRYAWCNARIRGVTLDVPCGVGWGASMLTKASKIVGLDRNYGFLTKARAKYPGIEFVQGDMTALPFQDATFDSIICCEGIEHVPLESTMKVLSELCRVLKPEGVIVGSIPLGTGGAVNKYHLTVWSLESANKALADAGLVVFHSIDKYSMLLFEAHKASGK